MVRILIVEDEPSAMRFLAQLLETRCPGVEIAGQAEDGEAAVELLNKVPIDIVITDIQMSPMSGTQLALWINQNKPEVFTLIVSGYSDFEYAKDAISAGVVEYLLKPVRPVEFLNVMEKLKDKAAQQKREAREKWLTQAMTTCPELDNPWVWPQEKLIMGSIWLGGLLGGVPSLGWQFNYSADLPEELAAIYASDESEICFAVPFCCISNPEALASALSRKAAYYTAIYTIIPDCRSCPSLLEILDTAKRISMLGKNQTLKYIDSVFEEPAQSSKEQGLLRNLRYVISNFQLDKIRAGLISLFSLWEDEGCRVSYIIPILSVLLQLLTDYAPSGNEAKISNIPDFASQICRQASSTLDLLQKTLAYCEKLYKPLERSSKNGQLINQIESYIQEHLGESLSTQQICSVFQISVSHLTQLFRHFVKMSFVEYVTQCRIEEAKRLMTEMPDMPIKSVSAQLGFSDQFYFSKVFRSITGVSPTEFKSI